MLYFWSGDKLHTCLKYTNPCSQHALQYWGVVSLNSSPPLVVQEKITAPGKQSTHMHSGLEIIETLK